MDFGHYCIKLQNHIIDSSPSGSDLLTDYYSTDDTVCAFI